MQFSLVKLHLFESLLTFKPRIQLEILIKESVVMENPCFMAHHKKFFSWKSVKFIVVLHEDTLFDKKSQEKGHLKWNNTNRCLKYQHLIWFEVTIQFITLFTHVLWTLILFCFHDNLHKHYFSSQFITTNHWQIWSFRTK